MRFTVSSLLPTLSFLIICTSLSTHAHHYPLRARGNCLSGNCFSTDRAAANAQVENFQLARPEGYQTLPRPPAPPLLSCPTLKQSNFCRTYCHCNSTLLVSCPDTYVELFFQSDGEPGSSSTPKDVQRMNEEHCAYKCVCLKDGENYWFGKSIKEWITKAPFTDEMVEEYRKTHPGRDHSFMYPLEYFEWMEKRKSKNGTEKRNSTNETGRGSPPADSSCVTEYYTCEKSLA